MSKFVLYTEMGKTWEINNTLPALMYQVNAAMRE